MRTRMLLTATLAVVIGIAAAGCGGGELGRGGAARGNHPGRHRRAAERRERRAREAKRS